jgi:hypothetical protein
VIQTHANLFLFLGNKSEAACYRAPAVALEFAHRNFWPVAYVSVNFSQEVAVVNIFGHLLKRWKFVVELISPKGLRCLVPISMYPVVGHGTWSVSLFYDHTAAMDCCYVLVKIKIDLFPFSPLSLNQTAVILEFYEWFREKLKKPTVILTGVAKTYNFWYFLQKIKNYFCKIARVSVQKKAIVLTNL